MLKKSQKDAGEAKNIPEQKNTAGSNDGEIQAKIAELINDLQRTRADFENYRKQVDLQKNQAINAAKFATVKKFLPLLDNLALAISAHPELMPLQATFDKTLAELGLSVIDSEPGSEFNPELHDAVTMEEGSGDREVVAETLRPGYLYDGEVLRAAMVKVTTVE